MLFPFKIVCGYLGVPLDYIHILGFFCFYLKKKKVVGFIGIDCIESVDSLHHTVFQFLGAGFLFVGVIFAALCSFQCTSLAPSVMFISKYFFLFYSIANGIVFFISLSGCLLSVQKYN